MMFDTWTLAVLAEMNRSAAMSRLVRPAATRRSTSSSRWLNGPVDGDGWRVEWIRWDGNSQRNRKGLARHYKLQSNVGYQLG